MMLCAKARATTKAADDDEEPTKYQPINHSNQSTNERTNEPAIKTPEHATKTPTTTETGQKSHTVPCLVSNTNEKNKLFVYKFYLFCMQSVITIAVKFPHWYRPRTENTFWCPRFRVSALRSVEYTNFQLLDIIVEAYLTNIEVQNATTFFFFFVACLFGRNHRTEQNDRQNYGLFFTGATFNDIFFTGVHGCRHADIHP